MPKGDQAASLNIAAAECDIQRAGAKIIWTWLRGPETTEDSLRVVSGHRPTIQAPCGSWLDVKGENADKAWHVVK